MADYPRRSTIHGSLGEERRRNRVKGIRQDDIQGTSGGFEVLKGEFGVDANQNIGGAANTVNSSTTLGLTAGVLDDPAMDAPGAANIGLVRAGLWVIDASIWLANRTGGTSLANTVLDLVINSFVVNRYAPPTGVPTDVWLAGSRTFITTTTTATLSVSIDYLKLPSGAGVKTVGGSIHANFIG